KERIVQHDPRRGGRGGVPRVSRPARPPRETGNPLRGGLVVEERWSRTRVSRRPGPIRGPSRRDRGDRGGPRRKARPRRLLGGRPAHGGEAGEVRGRRGCGRRGRSGGQWLLRGGGRCGPPRRPRGAAAGWCRCGRFRPGRARPMRWRKEIVPELPHDVYPLDPWALVETAYTPDLIPLLETVFALGNGRIGVRGSLHPGTPSHQPGVLINGFYESWPIQY